MTYTCAFVSKQMLHVAMGESELDLAMQGGAASDMVTDEVNCAFHRRREFHPLY